MGTDISGSSRPRRRARHWLLSLVACAPGVAQARDAQIAIPATTLDVALNRLAHETGIDLISTEPGIARVRTRSIAGAMPVAVALDRLLANSGYRAIAIDGRSFRVVRAPLPVKPVKAGRSERSAARRERPDPQGDIVVTASKQRVPLLRYPGTLSVIAGGGVSAALGAPDMSDVARVTPVLQSTELGPGRNKIFIRGIADSSFNGAAQSTASVYFGDVQLGYSGADPSVKLYDMRSIEVMEGPQGTLYGAGSIGGVIRLTPNPVDLTAPAGMVSGGTTLGVRGAPGYDVAGMVNMPVLRDTLGVRLIAYREHAGGYIDDVARGVGNINGIDTTGGRAAVRIAPGGGWTIDLGGLYQRIEGQDGQYADTRIGALARSSAVAQPFHNVIGLGSVVVTKIWDSGLQLLSATGVASYHSADLFDATALVPVSANTMPTVYHVDGAKLLWTQETRLSRSLADGNSWVVGFTVLSNRDAAARTVGRVGSETDIIGVTNVTRSASVFGETTLAVLRGLSVTLGSRLTLARTDGEPSFRPRSNDFVLGRDTRRIDPTIGFSWAIGPDVAVYGRIQSGYRTGGLAVARGVGRVADFRSDSIRVGELGIRRLRRGETGLAVSAALSFARWTDIQADLVNRRGSPYTDNIGNANVQALEGNIDWVPVRGLRATGAFLYTHNAVTGPMAMSSRPANRRLPETPAFSAQADLSYEWRVGTTSMLNIGGSANRVGRSVLGTGDLFDISQGDYTVFGAHAGWRRERIGLTLGADNLTDRRGNRFAFGNPFALAARDQTTPLRPFNVRLGGTLSW